MIIIFLPSICCYFLLPFFLAYIYPFYFLLRVFYEVKDPIWANLKEVNLMAVNWRPFSRIDFGVHFNQFLISIWINNFRYEQFHLNMKAKNNFIVLLKIHQLDSSKSTLFFFISLNKKWFLGLFNSLPLLNYTKQ